MPSSTSYAVVPVAWVHSSLHRRADAPRQGSEGAPDARLQVVPDFVKGLRGIEAGQEIVLLTWLHQASRDALEVNPRGEPSNPLTGVFATRSPDRPNPIGLHRVRVLSVDYEGWLQVQGLEAIDGTPIIDIKPVLEPSVES
jgi:tRNA-Thr(GGU) m(6)t(6)A37 methyltransferase TsaA